MVTKDSALPASITVEIDTALADLTAGATGWSALPLAGRRALLGRIRSAVGAVAEEWADVACTSKGLEAGHPLRGEEWLSGPYAALTALDAYRDTLAALEKGLSPIAAAHFALAPGGRTVVHTSPLTPTDALLLSGYTTEVWLEPGVSTGQAIAEAGLGQRTPDASGGIGLVLGAGNITSIPFLDLLYELLAFNRVSILKVNPTQDALVPVFTRALAPLIEQGFLRIVTGGGDVGAYLTQHPLIEHVHITGSAATFRAIVWGGDEETPTQPKLSVPITAELGGVAPIIIVPGVWSQADLTYHAEHIVTMRLHNSGHNCIAGQVIIMSSQWPQRDAFLAQLRLAFGRAPERPVWYPHSDDRLHAARAAYPALTTCGPDRLFVEPDSLEGDHAAALETTEYFSPVLGAVELPGLGQEFVDAAVAHANDKLVGTLGANVLIDPVTHEALGAGFDSAIAALHYGTVAINAWTALGFLTPTATWGAYPGGTLSDAESGIGIVHNAFLLSHVERSVVRGPFRPFPRSIGKGTFSALPKPPWFVSSRTGAAVCEGLTRFKITGSKLGLVGTLAKAMRS